MNRSFLFNGLDHGQRLARQVMFSVLILGFLLSSPESSRAGEPGRPGLQPLDDLVLAAPIASWDEAIPLGNGTMGVLVWGEGGTLRLSLDRGDLWDERPSPQFVAVRDRFNWRAMQDMVTSNRMDEFNQVFDANYDYNAAPTKLPAGRVEIDLAPGVALRQFRLNLNTAEARAVLADGVEVRGFVDAAHVGEPVAVFYVPGKSWRGLRLLSPESVKKLGYPAPRQIQEEDWRCFEQPAADGFSYAVGAGWKSVSGGTLLAVTVATRAEGKSPSAVAQARVRRALAAGYGARFRPHAGWWEKFWARSSVEIPDVPIRQQYHLVRYFYGAASRRGAPPMPLQGVWSADAGSLPPWKGDYHNDLNTQMTYLAYRTSGDWEEGACFLDYLWNLLPRFRQFAQDFYGTPGAAVPGVMSLAGQPLGGWGQYSLSPTMGAWNAHLFYLHWRHTWDVKFLRQRAYPFCVEIGRCLESLLHPNAQGILVLPLSSSPEIFDNTRRAFLQPNSNYDLASLRMLFLALQEMASVQGLTEEASHWGILSTQLGPFHTNGEGTLLLDARTALPGSHRHLSNLMPLHPFNLLTIDGGGQDRQVIRASLADWDRQGTKQWCGYSFSWMACLRARVGDAEEAWRNLDIFARAFVLRNGFHANGDQTKSGHSSFTYRPFTLEGNFLAMEAVHEMLLQSWNPRAGDPEPGPIRLFPATPGRWREASFAVWRAEGGHRVSARRENNATTWFRIVAGRTGKLRIRDNFGGREPQWQGMVPAREGQDYVLSVRAGQVVSAVLPKPAEVPAAPAPSR